MPASERAISKVIRYAVEDTYGTDAEPDNTQCIETEDWSLQPAQAETQERNIDRPGYGGTESSVGPTYAEIGFKVALSGSGEAGTAPSFADLMRSHGYSVTNVVDTSSTLSLASGDLESGTLYYYREQRLRRLMGYRGSAGFKFEAGKFPYMMCSGFAQYAPGEDAQDPGAAEYNNLQTPKVHSAANTPDFSFGGVDLNMMMFEINDPKNVKYQNHPGGYEAVEISGRRNFKGKMTVLQTALGVFDPESWMKGHLLKPVLMTHGVSAGGIMSFAAPQVQIIGINEGESDGRATWDLDLNIPSSGAGDDEFSFAFT